MGFGSRIESSRTKGAVDLLSELAAAKFDAARWIESRDKHLESFFLKMFSDAAEIFDAEFLTKAKDAVNQNDVHSG